MTDSDKLLLIFAFFAGLGFSIGGWVFKKMKNVGEDEVTMLLNKSRIDSE